MEKLTRKKVYEIANGRPVIRSGYCKITPLLQVMEREGQALKIGYCSGVHGWNCDVWEVGPVIFVEGYRPFGDIYISDYFKNKLEKNGNRICLAASIEHFTDWKEWKKTLPSDLEGDARGFATTIYQEIIELKIAFGKDFSYSRKFRPIHQVGSAQKGYRPYYSDDKTEAIKKAAAFFNFSCIEGNDAPRGGQLGKFIVVTNKKED